ncbi:MAG: 2-(1,2-epoxy-1,2-dihydrophenyl)acetyl-CoA isomerase [Geminicoccaceae bacterium]|nr:2-(1,2-epoxy-1,2-dihydrophenyl)acetyl-CoA isomerase [Geminicoccaceae bacterium]
MNDSPVLYDDEGGVALVTLNRPDRLNAFNVAMQDALRACLERAATDSKIRAVLLTGNGRAFSAGQDLDDDIMGRNGEPPDLGEVLNRYYNPLVRQIRDLELPVICAVNGIAAGASVNIALACDLVFAARSASFTQPFQKIGLMPDAGGTWFLPRLLGPQRAMGLALLGERLSAEQAEKWGLIWKVVDDENLLEETFVLARELARGPTKALGLTKRAIHCGCANSLDQQLDLETRLQRMLGRSADYQEGVAAFRDKRRPTFRGE